MGGSDSVLKNLGEIDLPTLTAQFDQRAERVAELHRDRRREALIGVRAWCGD